MDAFALQLGSRLDAFPGGGDLDQHAVAANACGLIERHQATGAGHGGSGVKRQACVDFSRDAAGHDLEDLQAKAHQHLVDDLALRRAPVGGHGVGQQGRVVRLLHRLQNQ